LLSSLTSHLIEWLATKPEVPAARSTRRWHVRYARDIVVHRVIAHIVDHKRATAPVLSDVEIPVATGDAIQRYFSKHIERSLGDASVHAARFVDPNPARDACHRALTASDEFVDASRTLAQLLFTATAGDQRIAAGDLAVCAFSAGNRPGRSFLALLKVDPSEVFTHQVTTDEHGRRLVSFEVLGSAMPTPTDRLHKCAFIELPRQGQDYDLILLDRQTREAVARPIANFFARRFLNCELAYDDARRTHLFYKASMTAVNSLRAASKPREADAVYFSANAAIAGEELNVDHWLAALPLAEAERSQLDETISRTLPDRTFTVDPNYREKLRAKVQFVGDNDLKLEMRQDSYREMVSVEHMTSPGGAPVWQVTIQTRRWEQKR
jgi:hypothetical protein